MRWSEWKLYVLKNRYEIHILKRERGFIRILIMKPVSESNKKPDRDPINAPVKEREGIDALVLLQITGGIFTGIFLIWIIAQAIQHLF